MVINKCIIAIIIIFYNSTIQVASR